MSNYNLYAKYRRRNLPAGCLRRDGHTPHTFSQITDNPRSTAAALRTQLNKDEMNVSRAKQIVLTHGYKLSIGIKEKNPPCQEALGYKQVLPKALKRNLE